MKTAVITVLDMFQSGQKDDIVLLLFEGIDDNIKIFVETLVADIQDDL